jgi:diguanylate cyclase (GGDEF)-like protein
MKPIFYCAEKTVAKKKRLPFPCKVLVSLKDLPDLPCLLIIESSFLKTVGRKRVSRFPQAVCLIHFSQEDPVNMKTLERVKGFDYFTDKHSTKDILFKVKRALTVLHSQEKIAKLEESLAKRSEQVDKLSLVDPLTGSHNWRYFMYRGRQELSRAQRHFYNLSFIIVDVDYFRQINSLYGTDVGDLLIKDLLVLLKKNVRKEDIITRWREDEFFIILPYLSKNDAYQTAKRLREKVTFHKFRYKKLASQIKISIGLVSFPDDKLSNIRDIIHALNSCLIEAKRKGGDTVTLYSQEQPPAPQKRTAPKAEELLKKIEKLNTLLTRDLLEMIYGFARAIEAKDHYTRKHVEYTGVVAEEIAKALKLPSSEVENVKRAAVLHDLGKVGIEESILSKNGPLTNKEKEIVRSHPWIATQILREIHALRGAIPAILYHHERFDGRGYPLGLKGEEIPLSARIVAIADVYQALVSQRPYRKAYSKQQAIKIIKSEAGKHFDPQIVELFLKVITRMK